MSKYIDLTRGHKAMVDDADYESLAQYKWYALVTKHGVYAVRDSGKRGVNRVTHLMHRVITDCPKGMMVDHKNHNTLDNTRGNLRVCDASENAANSRRKSFAERGVTSIYKGVSFSKAHNKFRTRIMVRGKTNELGLFACEKEAAKFYNETAKKLLGDFACVGRVAS